MCSKKRRRIASCRGSQQIEELLASSGRKAVRRMAHDVGVNVIGEVETDRESSRIRIGSVVGNQRKTGRVGESQGYRSRIAREVWRASERNSLVAPSQIVLELSLSFRIGGECQMPRIT